MSRYIQGLRALFSESIAPPEWYKAPPRAHVLCGEIVGGMGFFWFLYRAKKDGLEWLGLRHSWDSLPDNEH
jgi:hypothetical protein